MTQQERTEVINRQFEDVTKNSWTWARLTEDEKTAFNSLNFGRIKSTKTVFETADIYELVYEAFLLGAGYQPIGWREPDTK